MKKIIFAALAASVLSTPAMAANWQGKTYGHDAVGVYQVNASVATFCKFGTSNTGQAWINSTVDTNYLGGAAEADGSFTLNIQKPSDDTVQAAAGNYHIGYAVCNTPFDMKLASQNGGLKSANTTTDTDFVQLVPYYVGFQFDGQVGGALPITAGEHTVRHVSEARAGTADVAVTVLPMDKLLIQGAYSDILTASLIPTV